VTGAEIDGDLTCSGSKFSNSLQAGIDGSGIALNARYVTVKGEVRLSTVRSSGTIYFDDAKISGNVWCDAAELSNPWMASTTKITGPLSEADPRDIGIALSAPRINATTMFLRDGFKADGAVELRLAQLTGDLDASAGSFRYEPSTDIDCARSLSGPRCTKRQRLPE
jgi:hypothetical protein